MTAALGNQLAGLNALLQIEKEAREAEDLKALGFVIANRTYDVLPYRTAVFWRPGFGSPAVVRAVSGAPDIDRSSPFVLWMQATLKALASGKKAAEMRVLSARDVPAKLRKGWKEWAAGPVLWCPLKTPEGRVAGGLWLVRDTPWEARDLALAERLAGAYGHALWARQRGLRPHMAGVLPRPSRLVALAAVVIVAALLTVRVEQTVLAPATVIPVDPAVVAAPQEGVVEAIEVPPNAPVSEGDVLFRLDPTAARNRLEVAVKALDVIAAELRKAEQLAFSDEESKARLALLRARAEEKQAEVAYAKDLLGRTVVRAPADGIAVYGDPNVWAGRPVRVGEKVLTVADPARAQLEIMLPVEDVIALDEDARVRTFLNVAPTVPVDGRLSRFGYEPEVTPEGYAAYRLTAGFEDDTDVPRIGQKGTAKIYGEEVSLFYYLFRRPLTALRQTFGL